MSYPTRGRRSNETRAGRPLRLETLEDRTLLSAASSLDLSPIRIDPSSFDHSRILVQFRNAAGDYTGQSVVAGTTVSQKLDLVQGLYEVRLAPGVTVTQALAAYRADAQVLTAEPDYLLGVSRIPNDPRFGEQWAWRNTGQNGGTPGDDIHAPQAWDVTTGNRRIVVSVMDTGIDYNHPDLYQNIWINQAEIPLSRRSHLVDVDGDGLITFADLNNPINQGAFKITDVNHDGRIDAADILAPMVLDAQGHDTGLGGWAFPGNTLDGDTAHPNDFIGWNFVDNNNKPYDDNSHGTHVAGTIGAMGNNGLGVAGINWQTSLMAVRFLNGDGNGSLGNFIVGLNYAVAHGARISNNSWSGADNSQVLYDAINNARAHGHIFVAAAGNDGTNTDVNPAFPSSFNLDNIVSVAASDRNDHLAGFSNYGRTTVDLAAPGVDILSTTPFSSYSVFSGTSMATPHVAGALALVWGLHPTWSYRQVINQVLNTVDKVPSMQGKTVTGGRLDLAAAVGAGPSWADPTPLQVVDSSATGPHANSINDVRLTFSNAINPATLTPAAVSLTGPDGRAVAVTVRAVAGSGNRQFDLVFATQTAPGLYTLSIGAQVRDQAGNPLQPYQKAFTVGNNRTFSSSAAVAIPDVGLAISAVTVNEDFQVATLQVRVNIHHTYDGDLFIHLQAPDGRDILLSNRRGGAGHDYLNTIFDDQGPVSIRIGQAPFTGSFQPEVLLGNLRWMNARGTWRLWVEDRAAGDSGTLLNWSLTFTVADATYGGQELGRPLATPDASPTPDPSPTPDLGNLGDPTPPPDPSAPPPSDGGSGGAAGPDPTIPPTPDLLGVYQALTAPVPGKGPGQGSDGTVAAPAAPIPDPALLSISSGDQAMASLSAVNDQPDATNI
jgi:subtilisin family serine protease/subtilisin-like proprotein convertase family protein